MATIATTNKIISDKLRLVPSLFAESSGTAEKVFMLSSILDSFSRTGNGERTYIVHHSMLDKVEFDLWLNSLTW